MMCEKSYKDERASDLIKQGWSIVTTSPKEYADKILGDTSCIGTQYVMQKNDPVPVAKPDVPSKAEELLKQENDLLKREVALLKQEMESTKVQSNLLKKEGESNRSQIDLLKEENASLKAQIKPTKKKK